MRAARTPTAASLAALTVAWAATSCSAPSTEITRASATSTAQAPPVESPHVTWDVRFHDAFVIDERVCWNGPMTRVMPESRSGLRFVTHAADGDGQPLAVGAYGIELGSNVRCAVLTVDMGRAAAELDDRDEATIESGALVSSPDLWLWRPEPWPDVDGALTLHVPEGMSASVPWELVNGHYVVTPSTWRMMCRVAVGTLDVRAVDVGDARFTIARLPGSITASDDGLTRWITGAAGAVSLVSGRFPVRTVQVLAVPVDGGSAIPFGMAIRGGGPAAVMLVSKGASDASLYGEWVGVHELSHLLIPLINREDAWLSEGLASYYQEVLRGRAGLVDEQQAWSALVDGFDRGKSESDVRPLSAKSLAMSDEGGYVPVYWGGAAIVFNLDVALRKSGSSLDALVAAVRVREPKDVQSRAANDIVGWFAESAPDVDVRGIVALGLASPFPDVEPALRELGVRRGRARSVTFVDDAPRASIRKAMMARAGDKGGKNVLNSPR